MENPPSAQELERQANAAYEGGQYPLAASLFEQAASAFSASGDSLHEAEMKNNRSVALLQVHDAAGALEAAQGTDLIFQQAADIRRQAMALSNQAAALDALGKTDEALRLYELANELLKKIREDELRSYVLKSISAIQLRKGQQLESMATMQAAITNAKKPSLKERLFRFIFKSTFKS